jgi:hypothetical protein
MAAVDGKGDRAVFLDKILRYRAGAFFLKGADGILGAGMLHHTGDFAKAAPDAGFFYGVNAFHNFLILLRV